MRMNLAKVFQVLAVAAGIAVVAFTGCSSTGSYKMPGADMFSWGKKKPADSSLAASNKTNLPAPPSSATTPHAPPTYAQAPGMSSPQARTASTAGAVVPTNPYGQPVGGAYANTGYPAAGGSSQGFYSPEYQPPSNTAPSQGGYAAPPMAPSPNAYSQTAAPSSGNAWNGCQRSFNWQSTAFVMRGLRVRLPPLALSYFLHVSGAVAETLRNGGKHGPWNRHQRNRLVEFDVRSAGDPTDHGGDFRGFRETLGVARIGRGAESQASRRRPVPCVWGFACTLLGRFREAIRTLSQADGGAVARFYQGRAHFEVAEYANAVACYEAAKTAGYDPDLCALWRPPKRCGTTGSTSKR
jgi:hypothetical protein